MVRSLDPHTRIPCVDARRALVLDRVVALLTAEDTAQLRPPTPRRMDHLSQSTTVSHLNCPGAADEVISVGQTMSPSAAPSCRADEAAGRLPAIAFDALPVVRTEDEAIAAAGEGRGSELRTSDRLGEDAPDPNQETFGNDSSFECDCGRPETLAVRADLRARDPEPEQANTLTSPPGEHR